ncbi:hypothetical protein Stube_13400 [Streptomyces tubercidicus]|uniref:Uncharacterized protein n=1 Tax=Streptomyces tubercidicus TaxID=47759 RepID=A0A640ULI2_9ACTN|nr:hypothetical protein Stube_13400 [Streptomyces tubercidicus]
MPRRGHVRHLQRLGVPRHIIEQQCRYVPGSKALARYLDDALPWQDNPTLAMRRRAATRAPQLLRAGEPRIRTGSTTERVSKMIGDATYTDFLGGRVTFTQTAANTVQMSGQFNEGFRRPRRGLPALRRRHAAGDPRRNQPPGDEAVRV